MDVSEVGRIAIGSSRSEFPLLLVNLNAWGQMKPDTHARVTHATSGENPSMWSFSRSRTEWEMNMGKYEFWTPNSLISRSNQARYINSNKTVDY
jgi:hypothetical protein